jgi:hypothetical protein
MADNQDNQQPGVNTSTFNKGIMKDYNESFIGEGTYTHARNAVNNSHDGQVGVLGNEPSNIFCVNLPYTLIGCIHLGDDQWVVFTTDDTRSEIGIFDESACTYQSLKSPDGNPINFNCLGFKRTNLITGVFRQRFDCDRVIYWDDGLNPSRTMNIDQIPVLKSCTLSGTCQICTEILSGGYATLSCEDVRLAPLITRPCIKIKRGEVAGTLPNGSYQAAIAYLINGVRVTDYLGLTTVQGLFTHENTSSSLEISIESIDPDFEEFELVILSNINAQQVAKKIGTYSSTQGTIYVDRWSTEYVNVSISDIVLRTEPIEKSDAMYTVNDYLLRIGSYSKFKFNYQPLANKITAKWVAVQYPADYYVKGNNSVGYMRDEQYAFFIRFVYNTGEFSESYHIPGRPPVVGVDDVLVSGSPDYFDGPIEKWKVFNTASVTSIASSQPSYLNGGTIVATGDMGYWESTEKYPATKPDIWNSNPGFPGDPLNLCGKPIRHHKMPDETVHPILSTYGGAGATITLLGVQFDNINFPLDNQGNPINSIVGYEILRGSREGNKSILAKGLLNNMREYDIPDNTTIKGLYQNYPYNDLRSDVYLTANEQTGENGTNNDAPLTRYRKDIFTFHSPDTTFNNPYLNPYSLNIYEERWGTAVGSFQTPYRHPKFKQITTQLDNALEIFVIAVAAAQAIGIALGAKTSIDITADKDLPSSELSAEWVGGGSFGVIADVSAYAAYALNIAAYAAYAIFFQTKVMKQHLLKLVLALIPKRQYAAQYNSYGFYTKSQGSLSNNRRRRILESFYVDSNIQQFTTNFQINNLNRGKVVAIRLNSDIADITTPDPATGLPRIDNSRFLISNAPGQQRINATQNSTISSYYGAMKLSIPSQYGQLESIKQFPIPTYNELGACTPYITQTSPGKLIKTGVLFGGDIYINRFTEKNSMFFFNSWLVGEPDLLEYDYTLYPSIPYPKYWINNREQLGFFTNTAGDFRNFDYQSPGSFFWINRGYFYLFNSGVRDFFVESEVNVAYRDWEDQIPKRHYDPYRFTDINLMFRSDYIKDGNYYKYDYSLSISKLLNSHITWGNMLERSYDPIAAETCYVYVPTRVRYSLPQQSESKRDTWRVFLANNYYDFPSEVSSIKSINKTGALFMMKYQTPVQFTGVEELKLDNNTNTKVTIGDGGLFNQPLQAVVNVDDSYEYGSNQGRYCSVNTTYGLFWVSQNQGKVFQFQGGLNDITNGGLKWWFAKYLPSRLLALYPEYPYGDNPVVGVGVQLIYDNTNEVLYLTKKDYNPKFNTASTLELRNGQFYIPNTNTPVPLTNTQYFEEANFTISYDPKAKAWISFHDWIPTFLIPGRSHFMSVKANSIWKHNITCTSYCNFYGVNYPFEIEFVSTTGQQVMSMRSIEYILEVYNYSNQCRDRYHVLDQNFDQAVIYNSEQISGVLELNLKTKNNPLDMLNYPQIGTNSIKIQFSKEENKYRFNQFWDVTKNRGEYIPNAIPMFNTEANGYIYSVNPAYVDYNKPPLERKKFRHYTNHIFLRKLVSGNNKFLFKISNEKLLQSPR